jgi:anti-anti-sigma regulatory factor
MVTTLLEKPPAQDAFPQAASPVVIIDLRGDYGIARREGLLTELHAIPPCDIAIIDMREVTHLDPTVLTCLTQLRERLRRSGPGIVRIVGLRRCLYEVFEIAELHHMFEAFETIADAMGEYGYAVTSNTRKQSRY